MSRRWQCTVCGYLHVGAEPPETCPVCGADRTKFILVDAKKAAGLFDLMATFKLHPVAAHFPSGLLPTAAFFLLLGYVVGHPGLDAAAFWMITVAVVVVPVSIGSGLHDWRKYFGGKRAPIFVKKIGLALVLLALGLAAMALRSGHPGLLTNGGWPLWLYFACLTGMVGSVIFLGHYGSILVAMVASESRLARPRSSAGIMDEWPRVIISQAPDAILAADATGIIRLWNRGAERIFGVSASEAVGQSLDLIIPETLRQRHWEGWAKVVSTGKSRYGVELLRVPARRGDGSRFSAEFSIVMLKDASGQLEGVAAILRDVSEQWEREKLLKEQLVAAKANTSP